MLLISGTDCTLHSKNLCKGFSVLTFYNVNALTVNYIHADVFCSLLQSFCHCVRAPSISVLSSVQMADVCCVCFWIPERQRCVQQGKKKNEMLILKGLY